MATDPCSESVFWQTLKGNLVLCSQTFKNYEISKGQQQIQSVADNAKTYYGAGSVTAETAQSAADAQKMHVVDDVNKITELVGLSDVGHPFINDDCDGFDFTAIGGGCINKWYVWGGLGLIVLIILGPYVLPLIFPRKG